MKKSEIKHVLDTTKSEATEKELVFTKRISKVTGESQESNLQPYEWDNVKHLTGNLYYVYDDGCKDQSGVYVGEFR